MKPHPASHDLVEATTLETLRSTLLAAEKKPPRTYANHAWPGAARVSALTPGLEAAHADHADTARRLGQWVTFLAEGMSVRWAVHSARVNNTGARCSPVTVWCRRCCGMATLCMRHIDRVSPMERCALGYGRIRRVGPPLDRPHLTVHVGIRFKGTIDRLRLPQMSWQNA